MSNYTVVTNFGAKDGLASGNPAKLVLGVQFTTEFTNIATAIASKFDGSVVFAPDGNAAQPSFGFTNNAGTGMFNAAGVLGWATNSISRVTTSTTGAVVVNAPTSGTALTINNVAGSPGISVVGPGTVPLSIQELTALPNNVLNAFVSVGTGAVTGGTGVNGDLFLVPRSSNGCAVNIATGNGATSVRFQVSSIGTVLINAAASTAATTTGFNLNVHAPTTASGSFGLFLSAGTNSADSAFLINNASNATQLFAIQGDGGVIVGAPTGGDKGLGSVNASAVYVNGVSVSTGLASLVAVKAALTARSLTTTPANDPDLAIAIPGAGTYAIEAFISHYNATPSFGISCNLNYSGTYTANSSIVDYATNGVPTAATNLIASAVATSQLAGNTGSALGIFAPLLITATLVATGAGTVAFSWAQSSSNASATNVGAGSYMTATKIA